MRELEAIIWTLFLCRFPFKNACHNIEKSICLAEIIISIAAISARIKACLNQLIHPLNFDIQSCTNTATIRGMLNSCGGKLRSNFNPSNPQKPSTIEAV